MKADKFGKFVSGVDVEDEYVNAVGDLMVTGNQYYFFCMDATFVETQLVKVDAETLTLTFTRVDAGLTYPTAACAENANGNFMLLSYNHEDKQTIVAKINANGNASTLAGFDIGVGDDVEEPIINHFLATGKTFPFQIGLVSSGSYFFNGFYNYTFSLVFTNLNSVTGVVQGQLDDGGFSAVNPIAGNKFAASRFNFGDNYFLPNVNLSTNAPSSGVDLGGFTLPELVDNARVKILRTVVNKKNVLIFASDTKSKQIGLFFYDEATGEFLSSRYLGFSNPFEVGNAIQTTDEGLLVCGTTYLAGRFPRICLIKLSAAELKEQLK
jgi:hypothetical protein